MFHFYKSSEHFYYTVTLLTPPPDYCRQAKEGGFIFLHLSWWWWWSSILTQPVTYMGFSCPFGNMFPLWSLEDGIFVFSNFIFLFRNYQVKHNTYRDTSILIFLAPKYFLKIKLGGFVFFSWRRRRKDFGNPYFQRGKTHFQK